MQLLERDTQVQALVSALNDARAEQGCVALVYGEAGIGKTSLIEHFIKEQGKAWRVLRGACDWLFTPRPLGPLHDIALQTQGGLSALLDSESNRTAIFSACLNELRYQSTIMVIEDVHWADEATLDLLKYLGRRIDQTASLIILTYRDDELGVDHPLRLLLGDLASLHVLHRISVSPLSEEAVHGLARYRNVDAIELHRLTNGNPFFVTEVLAVGSEIPETVRDAVLARAARLSPSGRSVLETAAVIGSRVEPWLLSKISDAAAVSVEECISKGMLQTQGEYYAFRHELARQTILESITPQRRIALHGATLNALKESHTTRNDLTRLASHAEGAKDVSAVLEYAPAAAKQASTASSHREAIALYELALQFADALPSADHAQMLEAYSAELRFPVRLTEQINILRKAIEIWALVGDQLREGRNLAELAIILAAEGRYYAESEAASHAAIAMLEALPPSAELAWAYTSQCYLRMMLGDCADAVNWGEKAIALAEHFEDSEKLARAHNYTGAALIVMDYERGRALLERGLLIGRKANLVWAVGGAYDNLGLSLVDVYQLVDAERYLTEGIAYATEHDDDYHLLQALAAQALARLYQGRWEEAIETASNVLQSRYLDFETQTYALLALARTRVRLGYPNALTALDEALALSMQAAALPRLAPARAVRAETEWLTNNDDLAVEEVRAVYEIAVSKKHPWLAGELAFWRWRAGDDFEPPLWIAKPFALQIAGNWRSAAEEWERRGCPYEQAMALMDGDEAAQRAALEIFERLGARPIIEKLKQKMRTEGIRIPRGPRPATRENRFGLTAREMEILEFLAKGWSNNAIAKQLSLSTRTVEHHIASILQKMEVQSSQQAVALALTDKPHFAEEA